MLRFCIPLMSCLLALSFGVPVNDGEDVGEILRRGETKIVTGQEHYPYLVDIKIKVIHPNLKTSLAFCLGVIIGKNAVLTAAHCLRGYNNPTIIVHAGIVDLKLEHDKGQKLVVKDYLIHKGFRNRCPVKQNQCCYLPNDIAIMWVYKEFIFNPTVQQAILNLNNERPDGKKGWILGWGDDNIRNNRIPMLQRGLVKVMSQQECENFNPYIYIPETVMCVKAPNGRQPSTADGDSGGPFVIDGVVYGICSQTLFSERCHNAMIESYTDVAKYSTWIYRNLDLGPPKQRSKK